VSGSVPTADRSTMLIYVTELPLFYVASSALHVHVSQHLKQKFYPQLTETNPTSYLQADTNTGLRQENTANMYCRGLVAAVGLCSFTGTALPGFCPVPHTRTKERASAVQTPSMSPARQMHIVRTSTSTRLALGHAVKPRNFHRLASA
jgi:hypothetical protein